MIRFFKIKILNRLRVVLKSFKKKEYKIIKLINYLIWKEENQKNNFFINEKIDLNNIDNEKNIDFPSKILVTICFYYNENKINNLKSICENIIKFAPESIIYIITNKDDKVDYLYKFLESPQINIFVPKDIVNGRFLPWYHLIIMKKYINDTSINYFMYLEDDILITKKNINYWLVARQKLQKYNLIPGFLRVEHNTNNNVLIATDYAKKENLKTLPKIFFDNSKNAFINTYFPYQGMYFYDRNLMTEHLNSISSNPDFGHGILDVNYINDNLIKLDLMAKANIGLIYKDPIKGFINRKVLPVDLNKKIFFDVCFIEHMDNSYANKKSSFANIEVKNVLT